MTIEEFHAGVKRVEAALQGSFDEKFVDCLWRNFENHEADAWARTCATLSKTSKSARSLILHDFIQLAMLEAGRSSERARELAARGAPAPDLLKLDIQGIAERVAKKTGKKFHRFIASGFKEEPEEPEEGEE